MCIYIYIYIYIYILYISVHIYTYTYTYTYTNYYIFFRIKVDESSQESVMFTMGAMTGVISAEPFRMDIFSSNEPVISLNAASLLKFEHLRVKPYVVTRLYS